MPLVLVRTPTYRRPSQLKRALACLQAQTHQEWICEVRDDCPDNSARHVVEEMCDPRMRYIGNSPQQFLIANLDACFRRNNPYSADYFFMLEDDNQVRPEFMERGIGILEKNGVSICQINQVVEDASEQHLSEFGLLDGTFDERTYQPEEFHLALFGGIGISNGGVFWSKNIKRELSFRTDTIPALDEYIRTFLVAEPIYICLEKLAVWSQNESETTRNLGFEGGWLRREIDLKASIRFIRRKIWKETPRNIREKFIKGDILKIPVERRMLALYKADVKPYDTSASLKSRAKQMVIRSFGRVHPSVSSL